MISLENVTKSYPAGDTRQYVARDLCFDFPEGEAMALIGRNGAGKSSLLRMVAGTMPPDRGRIVRRGRVSWPVGFQGSFHPDLTGLENLRFVARVYGVDTGDLTDFVADFAELGPYLRRPVRDYSAGMKARLAFAISMGVPFDTYLIDEVTSVGDGAFRQKSEEMLRQRLTRAGAIVVSHSMELLARLCTSGAVLERGRLFFYARVTRAIEHHDHLMQGRLPPWLR
ncbi:putative cell surface polysaccharide export ABC-2 transporter ATP-binding protein [Pseudooceanicola batsensis HTCC2597]|uniref:Putative cell surface polysaccharide export ABC-2 transporter ATP-binding protein n=1 Tax=Pseudooceanicola batsensis (strain ATCC BAA-863 / DSM 15984 / KCTC 12145 / HTCC2597) TaxID=252305 RepID=A3TY54_PSEBH|nr:ABC transporter ATP-binding protein [Pseudooceanicola batsensis]EAQ03088.1 putative cell surface polysaccharide export ABC-2 transporter ATP-binding protein [Pseudooceanicola batsensis HTCC2597]